MHAAFKKRTEARGETMNRVLRRAIRTYTEMDESTDLRPRCTVCNAPLHHKLHNFPYCSYRHAGLKTLPGDVAVRGAPFILSDGARGVVTGARRGKPRVCYLCGRPLGQLRVKAWRGYACLACGVHASWEPPASPEEGFATAEELLAFLKAGGKLEREGMLVSQTLEEVDDRDMQTREVQDVGAVREQDAAVRDVPGLQR